MTTNLVLSGNELALSASQQVASTTPIYLAELLAFINRKDGTHESMLHSIPARFLDFVGSTAELVPIDAVHNQKESFIAHLKASKYKNSSVKSYRNYLNMLLRRAEELGWVRPALIIPAAWQEIADVMPRSSAKLIVRYAARIGKSPSVFSEDDLSAWRQERVKAGRSLVDAERDCSRFRNAIAHAGLSSKIPLVKPRDKRYGMPLSKMHPELREEIQRTIAWKLNEFEIDRPSGARIRPISAKRLNDLFGQLTGYVQNIERKPEVTSLSSLITREHIARFTSWATNERKVKGQSLSTGLGMVYAALRHNPCYKELDLNWFENIIDQLPIESQSTVDQRKARKYIPYSVAEQIPKRIRAKRMKLKSSNERIEALYAHNELLMLWILLLPWRQRNIRELRVGGRYPNLFKAAIRHYCTATKPNWVAEQERLTPDASFWHIRFAPHETKMKHSVQIFLPAELLPLLQDYLSKHRPVLVRNCDDAGTLFVNHKGKAMNVGINYNNTACGIWGQVRTQTRQLSDYGVPMFAIWSSTIFARRLVQDCLRCPLSAETSRYLRQLIDWRKLTNYCLSTCNGRGIYSMFG
jgi:hypothetical protein